MTNSSIRVGSRKSPLALNQVEEIRAFLRAKKIVPDFQIVSYTTTGDRDKKTPLSTNPADDFFTDSIDSALLSHDIDIAVHSAKDLPHKLNPGLAIFALTECLDPTDSFVGKMPLAELPTGSLVGTSSLLRGQEVIGINPDVKILEIRGTIGERLQLLDEQKIDGLIVATCALKRLGLQDRVTEILPWETTPLQGQLAVVGRRSDPHLRKIFEIIDARRRYGHVLLVGAGPGDPDLITVKGIKALNQADCVFYDYLASPDLLQHAPDAEKIYVGKRKGRHTISQKELDRMLKDKACEGKNVVRLKGGDPLIFGRGAEEIAYLRSYHISVDVIPGVSSATGIPALLNVPLTARGIAASVAFVSGHEEDEDRGEPRPVAIPKTDTIVFLMGLTKLPQIIASLRRSKWKEQTPVMIISKGTTADQKIAAGTIQTIEAIVREKALVPPALIVVGEVTRFYQEPVQEDASEQENASGILYVGTNPEKYEALGKLTHVPTIEISSVVVPEVDKKRILDDLFNFNVILLTSRFGVRYFWEFLQKAGIEKSQLAKCKWVTIGKETESALKSCGLNADFVSGIETSRGLFELLSDKFELSGLRILFPRSSLPNPYLKEELTKKGAAVTELTIYENKKAPLRELPIHGINQILFTSPSTVRNFIESYGAIPWHWRILSKGPLTTQALKEAGYDSEVLIYE